VHNHFKELKKVNIVTPDQTQPSGNSFLQILLNPINGKKTLARLHIFFALILIYIWATNTLKGAFFIETR